MIMPSDTPLPLQAPKFSVEAARLLLEQALEAEKAGEDTEAEVAPKHASNAPAGASILVPPFQNEHD